MQSIIRTAIATLLLTSVVNAQEYKDEILEHIIDPCYEQIALSSGLTEYLDLPEAVDAAKMLAEDDIKQAIIQMDHTVRNLELEDRMKVYKMGHDVCIYAAENN